MKLYVNSGATDFECGT